MMSRRRVARNSISRGFRLLQLEDRITPALTTMWDPAYGALTVSSNGSDSITIGSDQYNHLTINGTNFGTSTGLAVNAQQVRLISVMGGPGNNLIDLSDVDPIKFPALYSNTREYTVQKSVQWTARCSITSGGGNDTITGSNVGDYIECTSGNQLINTGRGDNTIVIRNQDVSSLTIHGSPFGHTALAIDAAAKDAAKMTIKHAVTEQSSTITYGGVLIKANDYDFAVTNDFGEINWEFSLGAASTPEDKAITFSQQPGSQSDLVEIPFSAAYKPGRLKWQTISLKRGITESMDAWKWRIDSSDVPTTVTITGTSNTVTVNSFGLGSSVTSDGVQVSGKAPVTLLGAASVTTESRFYDAAALQDLNARGITISAHISEDANGFTAESLTIANASTTPIGASTLSWSNGKSVPWQKHKNTEGDKPTLEFVTTSPGPGVTVTAGDSLSSMHPADVAAGAVAEQTLAFSIPSISAGQSSTNALTYKGSAKDDYHTIRAVPGRLRFSAGGIQYDIDLTSSFETIDRPGEPQFAAAVNGTTGATPSGGATSLLAVTPGGSLTLVSSTATGIDPAITTFTQGGHLYIAGRMVDVASDDQSSGNAPAGTAAMSADGRWVTFESAATNLVAGLIDTNGATDVFLRDMVLGTTYCLSATANSATGALSTGNGASFDPRISWDGRHITFRSSATDLVAGVIDTNNEPDLFYRNRDNFLQGAADVITCLSLVPSATTLHTGNKGVTVADMNRDGTTDGYTVAFVTEATDTGAPPTPGWHVAIERLGYPVKWEGPALNASFNGGLQVSLDGSTVVLWTDTHVSAMIGVPDNNNAMDILRLGVANGGVECISLSHLGISTADGPSPAHIGEAPAINWNGSVIAFTSVASNLIPGLASPASDGVYQIIKGSTVNINRVDATSSTSYGSNNHGPSTSADGFTVAWISPTSYISGVSTNGKSSAWVKHSFDKGLALVSSTATDPDTPCGDDIAFLLVTGNGEQVAFSSAASDLVASDTNAQKDVFISQINSWRYYLKPTNPLAITLSYDPATSSITIKDTNGTLISSHAATSVQRIDIYGRPGSNDSITVDTNGLQPLGGNVVIHGHITDNDKVIFGTGLGKTDVMDVAIDYKPATPATPSKTIVRSHSGYLLDGADAPSGRMRFGTGVSAIDVGTFDDNSHADQVSLHTNSSDPHAVTKPQVGLGIVDLKVATGPLTVSVKDFYQSSSRKFEMFMPTGTPNAINVDLSSLPAGAPSNLTIHAAGDVVTVNGTGFGGLILDGGDNVTPNDFTGKGSDTVTLGVGGGTYRSSGGSYKLFSVTGQPTPVGAAINDKIIDAGSGATLDATYAGSGITINLDATQPQAYIPGRTLELNGTINNLIVTPFDDFIIMKPLAVPRYINGGSQVGPAADRLVVDAQGKCATVVIRLEQKLVLTRGLAPIAFDNIEQLFVINQASTLQVADVAINDGATQRSRVNKISVAFNSSITFNSGNAADAFVLTNTTTGQPAPFSATAVTTFGFTVVTLTFPSGAPNYGSLADGAYSLSVLASQVTSPLGALDGNGDGVISPGGENYLTPASMIFCLFGDGNADRTVDQNDYLLFRNAVAGGPNMTYDSNQDNDVDQSDYLRFRNNIGAIV
ncbi:MAG: hypothetical protein ACJ8C4_18040 [Gemmataceae bacterium]